VPTKVTSTRWLWREGGRKQMKYVGKLLVPQSGSTTFGTSPGCWMVGRKSSSRMSGYP
jgi:hypothetical protein